MENKEPEKISPRQRALNTVKNNIERIYGDTKVREYTLKSRRSYGINYDLYDNCKKDVAKIRSIHKLIKILTEKWIDQSHQYGKDIEIINASIAKQNIMLEVSDKNEARKIIDDLPKIMNRNFARNVIENYAKGTSLLFQRMNINPEIWSNILTAKLLTVPEEKVLECKESILKKDYLPSINDFLQIQINELTTQDDLNLISKDIKKKQNKYKEKHEYINAEREYPNREINKIITDLHNQGLKHKDICKESQVKNKIKNCTPAKISEALKVHKKYIRENKKFDWFLEM